MASKKKTSVRPGAAPAAADRRIEHVVVLMLENHSFDHIFGFRPGVEGLIVEAEATAPSRKPRKAAPAKKSKAAPAKKKQKR